MRPNCTAGRPISPGYDLPHLREIHRRIFGGSYKWAGQTRTAAIAKVAVFCLPRYVESAAAVIFRELHDEDCLRGLRHDMFVARSACYLGEVNALHRFREGPHIATMGAWSEAAGSDQRCST